MERWLSGLKQRFAKASTVIGPQVRILPSPQIIRSQLSMEDNKGISIVYKICIVIMVLLLAPMFLIGLVGFGIYWLLKKFF